MKSIEEIYSAANLLDSLIHSAYGDGLALRIVELVHGADVHYHHESPDHDESENRHHKQSGPDRCREEHLAILGVSERPLLFHVCLRLKIGNTQSSILVGKGGSCRTMIGELLGYHT